MERAHYHCQYKKFSRAKGQSAVQAAAYRLGAKLHDERTGLTHDYTRRRGVTGRLVATPQGQEVPSWVHDPARLWNAAEAAEKQNPRALIMHEWEIALPHVLSAAQRREAARAMAQHIADRYGCVAMAAFHDPGRAGDARNYHVHLMFTTRAIEKDGFAGSKFRNYSLLEKEARAKGLLTGAEEIVHIKKQWEITGNRHLERAGHPATLDHRSYADQGLDIEPQKHLGPQASAKERRGERTAKGDFNRAVQERNDNRRAWAKAWEQALVDIAGKALPAPAHRPSLPFGKVAGSRKEEAALQPFSKEYLALFESQKQERTSLIRIQMAERAALWRAEQELRASHKKEWARLYRQQRAAFAAMNARFGTWTQRILRKLDITRRLSRAHSQARETLARQQKTERAHMGRENRQALQEPALRLETRHRIEIMEIDRRHLAQRQEMLARDRHNQALLARFHAQDKARGRDSDRDPGRSR